MHSIIFDEHCAKTKLLLLQLCSCFLIDQQSHLVLQWICSVERAKFCTNIPELRIEFIRSTDTTKHYRDNKHSTRVTTATVVAKVLWFLWPWWQFGGNQLKQSLQTEMVSRPLCCQNFWKKAIFSTCTRHWGHRAAATRFSFSPVTCKTCKTCKMGKMEVLRRFHLNKWLQHDELWYRNSWVASISLFLQTDSPKVRGYTNAKHKKNQTLNHVGKRMWDALLVRGLASQDLSMPKS